MRTNVAADYSTVRTHEGAQAFPHLKPIDQLRRSVLACMLWERQFYEGGQDIADRIADLAKTVDPEDVSALAIEARSVHNLRHAPLLLACGLIPRGGKVVSKTIEQVIQRPDEMGELISLYWRDGKKPLSAQLKKGLTKVFRKFDAYQLAKYNRADSIKLRDVMFMTHPKPKDEAQAEVWRKLAEGTLESPDTWEVGLSSGADKRETFTRLLAEGKLGYMALLRNLRNMSEAGVDDDLITNAILARKGAHRVLPFRYVAAARACPRLEPALDQALVASIAEAAPLPGKTVIVVDVSVSMNDGLSARSELTRLDAAAALASVVPGDVRVFTFSFRGAGYGHQGWQHDGKTPVLVEVPPRRGMSGVDAVINSQERSGTLLGRAVTEANAIPHDRLIVITDEQSHDTVPDPVSENAYMINVASNKNGVGYGKWTHLDGFSEAVIKWIQAYEANQHSPA